MDATTIATITGAVDFAPIIVGIGAITAAVALVVIAKKGAGMLLSSISGRG